MKLKICNEANELNYYFGGLFDGIGKIYIHRELRRDRKQTGLTFVMNLYCGFDNKNLAKLFQQNFGGLIHDYSRSINPKTKNRYKKPFVWRSQRGNAMDFLCAIQPYILGKKMSKKVEVAIKFEKFKERNLGKHNKTHPSIAKKRKDFYQKMRKLNR